MKNANKENFYRQVIGLFFSLAFMCALALPPAAIAKPAPQNALKVPAPQVIDLARKARQAGRAGNDARANLLWNRARKIDPGISAPPDWSNERSAQRFVASSRERKTTREELLTLISMLPYKSAQKQISRFLDRFPNDTELRELSLAMASMHQDERLTRLHDSVLSGQDIDNYTWLYGTRLIMLLGYVFLIRLILKFKVGGPIAPGSTPGRLGKNAGEQV